MPDGSVGLADILSALSHALDLVEGQTPGHAVRTLLIATRIAERLGLPEEERAELYFAALLKDAGCSANSVQIHRAFGDDHRAKHAVKLIDWTKKLDCVLFGLKTVHRDQPLPHRLRGLVDLMTNPESSMVEVTRTRCDRGAQIALRLGFGQPVAEAVRSLDEHWDGFGAPLGLKGEAIPLYSRILLAAQTLDVMVPVVGRETAFRTLRKRSGRWFDPAIVRAAKGLEHDEPFWQSFQEDARKAALDLATPATIRQAGETDIDVACDAFAAIIDAKSSFTASHSTRVTKYAVELGTLLEFGPQRLSDLRRAGLLHDIGKLGVPTAVLEKPGKLTEGEFSVIRSHPANTERILEVVNGFGRVTQIAAAHHERIDGKGYHRGVPGEWLDVEMRILAVADVFDALSAERPYRKALELTEVFEIMERERGQALDADLVGLLKERYLGANPQELAAA